MSEKGKEVVVLRTEGKKLREDLETVQGDYNTLKKKCQNFEKVIESYVQELAAKNEELMKLKQDKTKLEISFKNQLEARNREIQDKDTLGLNLEEMHKILIDKEEEITRYKTSVC